MKKLYLATAIMLFIAVAAEGRSGKSYNRFRVGITAGACFPYSAGPDIDAQKDNGYENLPGIGGKIGFDFYIPLYKGLFLMPEINVGYNRSGTRKDDYDEKTVYRADLETHKRYPVTFREGRLETNRISSFGINVPVTLGYTFRYDKKVSYSIGISGYFSYPLGSVEKRTVSEYKSVTPDNYNESGSSEEESVTDLMAGSSAPFKDRIVYRAGAFAGMRIGKFFWNYAFHGSLKNSPSVSDPEKKNRSYSHDISIGIYF